ncbi:MAG: hypothetical protein IIA40_13180 [SAR324 cluster bacterium]|nr:hypothetical protein [SAR324 cluster bacterium]
MALSESEQLSVKIYSLGRFLIEIDGNPIRFAAKAQREPLELLKALVALGGETAPVEHLTESLWPEAEGDKAQGSLAATLHRVRGLIGNATLRHGDARLTLDPGCCRVDAWAFSCLLQQASRAVRAALALRDWVRRISRDATDQGGEKLVLHAGIASGLVVCDLRDDRDGRYGIAEGG